MDEETRKKILQKAQDDRFNKENTPVYENDAPGLMQMVSNRYKSLQNGDSLPEPDQNQPDMYEKSMIKAGGQPLPPNKDDQSSDEQNNGFFSKLKNAVADRYNQHMKDSEDERIKMKGFQDRMFPSLHKNDPNFKQLSPEEEKELYAHYINGASGVTPTMGVVSDVGNVLKPEAMSLAERIKSISKGEWKPQGMYGEGNSYSKLRQQLGQESMTAAEIAEQNAKDKSKMIVK